MNRDKGWKSPLHQLCTHNPDLFTKFGFVIFFSLPFLTGSRSPRLLSILSKFCFVFYWAFELTPILIWFHIIICFHIVSKYPAVIHASSHHEGKNDEIMFHSIMIVRGILYIGGKWYGMEPLNTSSTFEHVLYELEDGQGIPFHCGVLNGSLEHEMFVKQSVKYTFSSNSTSSRDRLLRVNIFLFLPWAEVQSISRALALAQVGYFLVAQRHFLVAFISMDTKLVGALLRKSWNRRSAQWDLTQLTEQSLGKTWNAQAAIQLMHPSVNYWHRDVYVVI